MNDFNFENIGFTLRKKGQRNPDILPSCSYAPIEAAGAKIEIVGEIHLLVGYNPNPKPHFALVITLANGVQVPAVVQTDRLKNGVISRLYDLMPKKS